MGANRRLNTTATRGAPKYLPLQRGTAIAPRLRTGWRCRGGRAQGVGHVWPPQSELPCNCIHATLYTLCVNLCCLPADAHKQAPNQVSQRTAVADPQMQALKCSTSQAPQRGISSAATVALSTSCLLAAFPHVAACYRWPPACTPHGRNSGSSCSTCRRHAATGRSFASSTGIAMPVHTYRPPAHLCAGTETFLNQCSIPGSGPCSPRPGRPGTSAACRLRRTGATAPRRRVCTAPGVDTAAVRSLVGSPGTARTRPIWRRQLPPPGCMRRRRHPCWSVDCLQRGLGAPHLGPAVVQQAVCQAAAGGAGRR